MDSRINLVNTIGASVVEHLRRECLSHMLVTLDEGMGIADVQVSLIDRSRHGRHQAIERFAKVEEVFDEQVSLMLRFTNDELINISAGRKDGRKTPAYSL